MKNASLNVADYAVDLEEPVVPVGDGVGAKIGMIIIWIVL